MRTGAWYLVAALISMALLVMPAFRAQGEYYGAEIYSLALDYPKIANHTVSVEGVLVGSGDYVVLNGTVSGAGRGYLVVFSGSREYTIGGPLAGREDVAAKKITVFP